MHRRRVFLPTALLSFVLFSTSGVDAGPSCCRQQANAGTSEAVIPSSETNAVTSFLETWSASGLQVQMMGGYIKLINGDGDVMTAARVSESTGIQLSDDELHGIIKDMFATSGAESKVQACGSPESATCSELTLSSDYDACLAAGTSMGTEEGRRLYAEAKKIDGVSYRDRTLARFEARDLNGESVDTRVLEGKPALVALLSEKCGHSMRSLSTLARLQRKYPDLNMVAVFDGSSPEAARELVRERKQPASVWVSPNAASSTETDLVPTIFLVDATGRVLERHVGEKMEKFLDEQIRRALSSETRSRVGMKSQ